MPDKVLQKSVQKRDETPYTGNGAINFLVPAFGGAYLVPLGLPPELPQTNYLTPYSKARDTILIMTPRLEGFWASALNIAISKVVSREIRIESPIGQHVDDMNILFRTCDGRRGFASYLERHLQDYFCSSNGAWTEIERTSRDPGAKILSFHHLDSLRVWRTGDPDTPAVYWDLRGGYHELKWWEVFQVTAMDSARAGFWQSGECASERAYKDIRAMSNMYQLFDEKITGSGYTEIEFIKGVTAAQINDAKKAADQEQLSNGQVRFMGKLVIPLWGDADVVGYRVPLKGLPDDWKRMEEFELRSLSYANSLGISPQELMPSLSGHASRGVGLQSMIMDENEQGRGYGAWQHKWTNAINNLVVPEKTIVLFVNIDLRDEERKADVALKRAQEISTYVQAGVLDPSSALYVAVDRGDLPREIVSTNAPVEENTSDLRKPDDTKMAPTGRGNVVSADGNNPISEKFTAPGGVGKDDP